MSLTNLANRRKELKREIFKNYSNQNSDITSLKQELEMVERDIESKKLKIR